LPQFIHLCTLPWYCDTSLTKIYERRRMLREREKKEKGHEQLLHFLYPPSSSSASNQPTNRSCSVAMANVTHTTIFRLRRSDTPTSQNQSICYSFFILILLNNLLLQISLVSPSGLCMNKNFFKSSSRTFFFLSYSSFLQNIKQLYAIKY